MYIKINLYIYTYIMSNPEFKIDVEPVEQVSVEVEPVVEQVSVEVEPIVEQVSVVVEPVVEQVLSHSMVNTTRIKNIKLFKRR